MASGSEAPRFSHLDDAGQARMVDIGDKEPARRRAVARCTVTMRPETAAAISGGAVAKGDVLAVARVAGIMAAKRTSETIPLCHPVMLSSVRVGLEVGPDRVDIEAEVETLERTGVEMEALNACAAAALTVYDMCKSADREMTVSELALWEKSGGRSGEFHRPA